MSYVKILRSKRSHGKLKMVILIICYIYFYPNDEYHINLEEPLLTKNEEKILQILNNVKLRILR